jgi:hypothetical protein
MKVHLLDPAEDFDFRAGLPGGHEDLIQDVTRDFTYPGVTGRAAGAR